MTASIQNAFSAYFVLERGLKEFEEFHPGQSAEEKLAHVEVLLDSLLKCLNSLAAQVRFYESVKGPGRALVVTNEDGSTARNDDGTPKTIDGQQVETLCLALPDQLHDAVVYGRRAALLAIAEALTTKGHQVTGPFEIYQHARQLAEVVNLQPDKQKAEVT